MYSSPPIWLTVDHLQNDDLYVIKYEFQNENGKPIQVKCDAREMDHRGSNQPGLGKYTIIDKRLCNVKFIKIGAGHGDFEFETVWRYEKAARYSANFNSR